MANDFGSFLGGLFGGASSSGTGSGGGWWAPIIAAGLQAYGAAQQQNALDDKYDKEFGLKESELNLKEEQFNKELDFRKQLELANKQLAMLQLQQSAAETAAIAAAKKSENIQQAYANLIRAVLEGSGAEATSMGNLATLGQTPLLRSTK